MKLELEHVYEKDLDSVLAAFLDERHILEKNQRIGSRNVKVAELRRDDEAAKLVLEREVTVSGKVPGILASFQREWNHVRQEEHWFRKDENEWHCEFRVRIEGVPAKIKGNMRLLNGDNSCVNQVSLQVRCDVPMLGKTIARYLIDDSREKIEKEYSISRSLIQARG